MKKSDNSFPCATGDQGSLLIRRCHLKQPPSFSVTFEAADLLAHVRTLLRQIQNKIIKERNQIILFIGAQFGEPVFTGSCFTPVE